MELLLRRDQDSGMLGGIERKQATEAEAISEKSDTAGEYRVEFTILYEDLDGNPGFQSITPSLARRFLLCEK